MLAVRSRSRRARRVIIIKAEGVSIAIDRLKALVDARLRDKLPDADPSGIETRVTVLGHVVRGGRPSAFCWLVDLGSVLRETDNLLQGKTPLARWRAAAFDEVEDALAL